MIGLGILTCNRPGYFRQVAEGVDAHLRGLVDDVVVYNDSGPLRSEYDEVMADFPGHWIEPPKNHGIAYGKNRLFEHLLDAGCDWIFIEEDDCVVDSPKAVTGYIDACWTTGLQHLGFHHHKGWNAQPTRVRGELTIWPNLVAGWSIYSRLSLETVGLMDENFYNALEHVEHTMRLAQAGFAHAWPGMADVTGSEAWLHEIPNSFENSLASNRWENFFAAKTYWQEAKPETYKLIWP